MDNYRQYQEYENQQPLVCTDCGAEIEEDFTLCPWGWCEECFENWKE